MKLKGVTFTSTSWDKPRNIAALGGNQTSIFVGQIVRHTARAENARIASLEFDGKRQQLLMRLVFDGQGLNGEKDGEPFRRMTVNQDVKDFEKCDVLGMFCDDRTLFFYDDEPGDVAQAKPAQQQPAQQNGQNRQGR